MEEEQGSKWTRNTTFTNQIDTLKQITCDTKFLISSHAWFSSAAVKPRTAAPRLWVDNLEQTNKWAVNWAFKKGRSQETLTDK